MSTSRRIGCVRLVLWGTAFLLGFALLCVFAWANKHYFALGDLIFWVIGAPLFFGSALFFKALLVDVLYRPKCPQCSRRALEFIHDQPSPPRREKLRCKSCGFEDYTGLFQDEGS